MSITEGFDIYGFKLLVRYCQNDGIIATRKYRAEGNAIFFLHRLGWLMDRKLLLCVRNL